MTQKQEVKLRVMVVEQRTTQAVEFVNSLLEACRRRYEQRIFNMAVSRGRKGGLTTAKRGSEYFREIAAMRKVFGGGRPKEL